MELTTGDLLLRPLHYADRADLAALADNRNIWCTLRDMFPSPYSIADAEKFIDMVKQQNPQMTFAMDFRHNFAGVISLIPQQDVYRHSAELGYWLGEPYWGQGITTAATRLVCQYAFDELQLTRIFASVFQGNIASARVLEKCGFFHEGTLRQAVIKDGKILDELRFALLKD